MERRDPNDRWAAWSDWLDIGFADGLPRSADEAAAAGPAWATTRPLLPSKTAPDNVALARALVVDSRVPDEPQT